MFHKILYNYVPGCERIYFAQKNCVRSNYCSLTLMFQACGNMEKNKWRNGKKTQKNMLNLF